MDRAKYSVVSHTGLAFCSPVTAARADAVLDLLDLAPGARAVDLGAGKGELLLRVLARYPGTAVVAVERNAAFVAEARAQAAARVPGADFVVHEIDAVGFDAGTGTFALAACVGATEIHGGFAGTARALATLVAPGGWVLVGDCYWRHTPDPDYLAAFGASADEFGTHADNVAAGVAAGLTPLYATTCSDDDWDRYEWLHLRGVEDYARAHPDDPDAPALVARIRAWRDLYLRWGRDTLGFGLYLFRK